MRDHATLGPWVRRFLLEHLVAERNLARNTRASRAVAWRRPCVEALSASAFAIRARSSGVPSPR